MSLNRLAVGIPVRICSHSGLFCLTPEIDELVAQLHASRKMVDKYNQLSAQQKISPDEATCLQDEKNSKNGYEIRLRDKLTEAMERGTKRLLRNGWHRFVQRGFD